MRHSIKPDQYQIDFCSLHAHAYLLLEIKEALHKLINEAAALWAFEDVVREVIGNTNMAVLKQRIEEARAVLDKLEDL